VNDLGVDGGVAEAGELLRIIGRRERGEVVEEKGDGRVGPGVEFVDAVEGKHGGLLKF
jgi:hypothetical protein